MYIRMWYIFSLIQVASAIQWDTRCGITKGCFPNCPNGCKYLVTWQNATSGISFSLQAEETNPNTYLAIGFSNDRRMGDDSVVACSVYSHTVSSYYNDDTDSNILSPNDLGISNPSVSISSGVLACNFTRSYNKANTLFFDLHKDFFLMLVVGDTEMKHGSNKISKHHMIPWNSDGKVNFRTTKIYDVYKMNSPLVKLHGIVMSFAWLFFCVIGIVTARYNKDMLPDRKLLDTKIWFQVHRGVMVITLVLVIIGFISIFVENSGYSQITPPKSREAVQAHPVLGIIVTVLCFANPIMALFRPGAEHKLRWLFNWAHLGVGVIAQFLAVVTIFLGYFLDRAMLPISVVYVTVGHLLVSVVVGVVLEVHKWKRKKDDIEDSSCMGFKETCSSIAPSTVQFAGLMIYAVLASGFMIGIASIIGGS